MKRLMRTVVITAMLLTAFAALAMVIASGEVAFIELARTTEFG